MANNAGTGGTEAAGRVHEMKEETWDFVIWVPRLLLSLLHERYSIIYTIRTR